MGAMFQQYMEADTNALYVKTDELLGLMAQAIDTLVKRVEELESRVRSEPFTCPDCFVSYATAYRQCESCQERRTR